MDLRQLRYFTKVVEAKSLTRAAESLHLAQPALSLQMQKLEDEIGQQLLVRHSRGIELTEAGERLLGHARQILQQVELAQRDVREMKGEPSGRVRLGMPPSVSEVLALDLIGGVREHLPKIDLSIVEMSETLSDALLVGRVDLGFSYNIEDTRRLDYEPLFSEKLCLVQHSGSASGGREMDFAQAASLPLILPPSPNVLRTQVEETAQYRGLSLNVVHEIDSVAVITRLVEAGQGSTILPLALVEPGILDGRLVARPLVRPEVTRRLYLVYPSRSAPSKPHLALRGLIQDIVRRQAAQSAFPGLVEIEIAD